MSDRLLNPDDLYRLTRYKQPRRQADQLRRMGIKFLETHDGRPVLTWEAVNSILVDGQQPQNDRPDFSWM